LGTDSPRISAATFRKQLREKRGAYCDLVGCGSDGTSVRSSLPGIVTEFRVSRPEDFPNSGQVDVFDVTNTATVTGPQRSPLLTLFFVRRHGVWRLQQIEYI
jgi:hypothetical protein